jgi:hypothetical protein
LQTKKLDSETQSLTPSGGLFLIPVKMLSLFFPQMGAEKGISAFPESDNLFKWIGTIQGPSGTVRLFDIMQKNISTAIFVSGF